MRFVICLMALLSSHLTLHSEMRGAWIASVHNINFPSKSGRSTSAEKSEIVGLLDSAKRAGLNAVLLQVRPESDALYASKLEPWSRYLTGTQGQSPGFDPLEFCIAEAKKRGIEVHAWINPYRAVASAGRAVASNHISRKLSKYAYRVGSVIMMDPGAPAVQNHILAVIRDILQRYDVAGIHFDDYFYPYPTNGGKLPVFPDNATYAAYRSGGGTLDKGDWRRENVNSLIRRVGRLVHSKSGAVFGVSPFGVYRSGVPAGVTAGVDSVNQLYCDALCWMRDGSIDYLSPQLYWKDGGPQSFGALLRWWRSPEANPRGVNIIPGIAVDRMSSHGWPLSEIAQQIRLERSISPRGKGGFILWNIDAVKSNTKGVNSIL